MIRTLAVGLALAAGGCEFASPGPELLEELERARGPEGALVRVRASVDIDGPWLAGAFEAVVVARTGREPAVRLQLFPDLGGKALDLLVRPGRITGYFPHSGEGIDWALPSEARAHPLLFMGITLLERFATVTPDRVLGVREGPKTPRALLLKPVVPGVRVVDVLGRHRFRWSLGVEWEEEGLPFHALTVRAPGVRVRVEVREKETPERVDESVFRLALPDGVRRL